ncbi:MAG: hypothetical protein GEEBNDBF_00889 [bacterium]|nr:hypothetical protein [bacterium]
MSRRLRVRIEDVVRRLKQDGWYLVAQEGSRQQYWHPEMPGRVTIAGSPGEVLHPKTLSSICRQAGWKGWRA